MQEYVPIAGPYSEEEKWMIDRVAADLDAAGVGYVVRDEPGEVIGAARHFTIYRATKGLQTMEQTAALQKPMPELSDG